MDENNAQEVKAAMGSALCDVRKQEPWRSDDLAKLCMALAKCQAEIKNPKKGKTANAGKFSYNYADISDVIACINAVAPKFGLAHSQVLRPNHEGKLCIFTMIMHESGQWMLSEYKLPPAGDNHEMGGNITYGRRYALAPLFGVASEDDTDFNGRHADKDEAGKAEFERVTAEKREESRKALEEVRASRHKKVVCVPDKKPDAAPAADPEPEKHAPQTEQTADDGKGGTKIVEDYTGIDKRLTAKLQTYDAAGCPLNAFQNYVIKSGVFGPKADLRKLPDDYVEQVLANWHKVEPKFREELLPF